MPLEPYINANTSDLWSDNVKKILKEKEISVDRLEQDFRQISFPWSSTYDRDRQYFSIRIQQRPLFIIKPTTIKEIEKALNFVHKKNLTVRICGGRHSTQLLSPEVLIDMANFNNISYTDKHLIVQAGATQGQANEFIFKNKNLNCHSHFGRHTHSSAYPGGSAQTVGVGGISTVGGIGALRRKFGLTVDSIVSFVITIPPSNESNAKTITVTQDNNHSDLFWALCGGGGNNFGVISEITYVLFEVDDVIRYDISWSINQDKNEATKQQIQSVIDLWFSTATARPNEFTEEVNIFYKKAQNQVGVALDGFYVVPKGQSDEDAIKIVKETLGYLGGTLVIDPSTKYSHLYKNMVNSRVYHNFSILQGVFTDTLHSKLIADQIIAGSNLNGDIIIEYELLGGQIKEATTGAFGFRNKNYFLNVNCLWDNLVDTQKQELWLNNFTREIVTSNDNGVYLAFPITFTDIPHTNKIYYGENYDRLKEVRNKYDPSNVLQYSGTIFNKD